MNWSWLSFVVGLLVAWLIEWLIDFIYWRRRYRAQAAEIADLQRQQEDAYEKQRELEQQAVQCAQDLEACRAELEAAQEAVPEVETRAGEGISLDLEPVAEEVDAAAFSPDLAREAEVRAGTLPLDELAAAREREGAGPWDDEPMAQSEPDEDVEAGATRAGGVVAVPLAGDTAAPEKEDLTAIEGIGPKVQELLNEAGIVNYDQLAATPASRLQEILDAAGPHYQMIKPGTWPQQARLAAEGRWDELEVLQACIVNGEIVEHDLTRIEGIGPKIQGLLYEAGIVNYNQLATTPVSRLEEILDAAGPRYRMADPTTWPEQARLAAEGKWDDLQKYQDDLKGGRIEEEDLTKIEGIGPKIAGLLNEAGIVNYWQLSDTPVSRIQEILDAAGPRYQMADPSTWPEQARLADEKEWDELQAFQDSMSGGHAEREDLTKIEGIGPKIAAVLQDAGLLNYALLADAPIERLREVLAAAGPSYQTADPSTWPEQARLAAEAKWDELAALQDRLLGGRQVDDSGDA